MTRPAKAAALSFDSPAESRAPLAACSLMGTVTAGAYPYPTNSARSFPGSRCSASSAAGSNDVVDLALVELKAVDNPHAQRARPPAPRRRRGPVSVAQAKSGHASGMVAKRLPDPRRRSDHRRHVRECRPRGAGIEASETRTRFAPIFGASGGSKSPMRIHQNGVGSGSFAPHAHKWSCLVWPSSSPVSPQLHRPHRQ